VTENMNIPKYDITVALPFSKYLLAIILYMGHFETDNENIKPQLQFN
jgi:hypothetical protein